MRLVLRTAVFHLLCILTFAFIYFLYENDFSSIHKRDNTYIDYLNLSVTIQAGVGISHLIPDTSVTKMAIMIQQVIMLFTNILTLYIFTL